MNPISKKTIAILVLMVISAAGLLAQEVLGNKYVDKKGRPIRYNIIKTNLLGWPLGMYNVTYERKLSKKYSAQLEVVVFGSASAIPSFPVQLSGGEATFDYGSSGFAITPEARIYLGKQGSPRGYYLGLYVPIINYKGNYEVSSTADGPNSSTLNTNSQFAPSISFYGLGLAGGPQFVLSSRVTLEFYLNIALGAYSLSNTDINLKGTGTTPLSGIYNNGDIAPAVLQARGVQVDNAPEYAYSVEGAPTNPTLVTRYNSTEEVNALKDFSSGLFVIPRIGFSLGYAFGK